MPASLFYQYATPSLIGKTPEGISPWVSQDASGWIRPYVKQGMTLSDFKRKLDQSPELANIALLANQFGSQGLEFVMRTMRTHMERIQIEQTASQIQDLPGEITQERA